MRNQLRQDFQECARQSGFALIFGLIMLALLTLLAVTAFHLGANQTLVVANAQHRNEGVDAAQQAIDTVINSSAFTQNPAAAIPTSNCAGGGANTLCVDSNGDGVSDFKVTLTPQPKCITIAYVQPDLANTADQGCGGLATPQGGFGVAGTPGGQSSICANAVWEVNAQAVDNATGTTVNVVQGVGVRVLAPPGQLSTICP